MAVMDPLRRAAADLLELTGDAVVALTVTAAVALPQVVVDLEPRRQLVREATGPEGGPPAEPGPGMNVAAGGSGLLALPTRVLPALTGAPETDAAGAALARGGEEPRLRPLAIPARPLAGPPRSPDRPACSDLPAARGAARPDRGEVAARVDGVTAQTLEVLASLLLSCVDLAVDTLDAVLGAVTRLALSPSAGRAERLPRPQTLAGVPRRA